MRLTTKKLEDLVEDCTAPANITYDFSFKHDRFLVRVEDYLVEHLPIGLRFGKSLAKHVRHC